MTKGMPEGLRKHFEEKEKSKKRQEGPKKEHKEALSKARKAKVKRQQEKEVAAS
jgi:hypothetical protein